MNDTFSCEDRPPCQGGKTMGVDRLVLGSRAPMNPAPLTQGYILWPLRGDSNTQRK